MGFWKKLRFWRIKCNVAVTTRDIATMTENLTSQTDTQVDSNVTTEVSSATPNNKHPGNKTDKKEEMKRNIAALEQFLEFKDSIIRKQKAKIQEMKEQQRRTEEVDTDLTCEAPKKRSLKY